MKIRNNKKKGFTLVEIMIVVLIIGILLAIAVPNFVRARERSRAKTCMGNLKQVDSAKEQYAMEERLDSGATVDGAALWGDGSTAGPYIKKPPVCPSGGTYTVGDVGEDPTCSIGGDHALDAS
jgi:prepilin-type N-terminal cleavage/methylation domain-containing protein